MVGHPCSFWPRYFAIHLDPKLIFGLQLDESHLFLGLVSENGRWLTLVLDVVCLLDQQISLRLIDLGKHLACVL